MKITIHHLTKAFPSRNKKGSEVIAVNDMNLEIPSGKLVGLLGPSGCGKSTTLFMLSGLESPTRGNILFDDQDVTTLAAERRGIGLVFQNYALYPHMTVRKNIAFPLENLRTEEKVVKDGKEEIVKRKLTSAEINIMVEETAKLVQIENLLDRKPSQLSGGQQQRVAIARALVRKPKVLLLDEPLSNLDARLRLQTREEIKRIQQETGITTVFVTHDQEEAMSISDEIVVMNFGVIQQVGHPQDVYNEPANMFVAKFLGTPPINILPARQEGKVVKFFDQELLEKLDLGDENRVLNIGVRPEFIKVDPKGKYEVFVEIVEYIGRDKTIIFKFKGQDTTCKAIIPSEINVNRGDSIKVNFSRYFVFDEDGNRLV